MGEMEPVDWSCIWATLVLAWGWLLSLLAVLAVAHI